MWKPSPFWKAVIASMLGKNMRVKLSHFCWYKKPSPLWKAVTASMFFVQGAVHHCPCSLFVCLFFIVCLSVCRLPSPLEKGCYRQYVLCARNGASLPVLMINTTLSHRWSFLESNKTWEIFLSLAFQLFWGNIVETCSLFQFKIQMYERYIIFVCTETRNALLIQYTSFIFSTDFLISKFCNMVMGHFTTWRYV